MFYSFGNFQKMFCAGVSFYRNFVDWFSKAGYCWLRSVENIKGSEGKNIPKKGCLVKRKRNFFGKWKSSHKNMQYSSHLLPRILPCKFISWISRKTIMPNCLSFPIINYSGDSHGGISITSNIFFHLRQIWSCLKYVLNISY